MFLEEGVCYDQWVLLVKVFLPLTCFILYSKTKFACYSRYFLTPYFCISVPYNEKDIFWGGGVLVLGGLVGLHRTVQLQLLQRWGIGLDYHDIEWFALEMNRDHSVVFEIASKYCI